MRFVLGPVFDAETENIGVDLVDSIEKLQRRQYRAPETEQEQEQNGMEFFACRQTRDKWDGEY
jgi:hypothetical protein